MIDITCNKEVLAASRPHLESLINELPEGVKSDNVYGMTFKDDLKNEAFKTSGEVSYVASAGRFSNKDVKNAAALYVLRVILSREYLYNRLRVLGGAYGCGFSFSELRGSGLFYSYRDPHVKETLDVYREAADYVANFTADEREMTKYVIGTMGDIDQPLTPAAKGARSMSAYLTKMDPVNRQQLRDYILSTTPEDIRAAAGSVREITETGAICAVGCESMLNANKDLFKEVKSLY